MAAGAGRGGATAARRPQPDLCLRRGDHGGNPQRQGDEQRELDHLKLRVVYHRLHGNGA